MPKDDRFCRKERGGEAMPVVGCLTLLAAISIMGRGVSSLGWIGFVLLVIVVRALWSILALLFPTGRQ